METSASFCKCHWKDWGCFPKYTVEENKHINIIMAVYEKYSKGNFFSLYSQQIGRVSVAFPASLWDGNFAGLFQNVLFFGPKGILNQAKMTPGFTASFPLFQPPLVLLPIFFFFFLMLNLYWEALETDLCLVLGFLCVFFFSHRIHFLSVKEVLASLLASTAKTYIKSNQIGK